MARMPDDNYIQQQAVHRLHHTAIPIDVLDLDKIVQRLVAVKAAETAPAVTARLGLGKQLIVVVDRDCAIPEQILRSCAETLLNYEPSQRPH
jgi:hypothetical protein